MSEGSSKRKIKVVERKRQEVHIKQEEDRDSHQKRKHDTKRSQEDDYYETSRRSGRGSPSSDRLDRIKVEPRTPRRYQERSRSRSQERMPPRGRRIDDDYRSQRRSRSRSRERKPKDDDFVWRDEETIRHPPDRRPTDERSRRSPDRRQADERRSHERQHRGRYEIEYKRSPDRRFGDRQVERRRSGSPDERTVQRSSVRSPSPYTLAMEHWNQFKEKETKLLKYAQQKLEKYDASPEEHPQYSEEWKKFWAKKFAEVKAAGGDPTTYNFSKDWIPFWAEKSRALLNEEVETRRKELLHKFHLKNDRLPIRSDFPRPSNELKPENRFSGGGTDGDVFDRRRIESTSKGPADDGGAKVFTLSPSPERRVENFLGGHTGGRGSYRSPSPDRRIESHRPSSVSHRSISPDRRVDSRGLPSVSSILSGVSRRSPSPDRRFDSRGDAGAYRPASQANRPEEIFDAYGAGNRRDVFGVNPNQTNVPQFNPAQFIQQNKSSPPAVQAPVKQPNKSGVKPKLLPVLRLIGAFSDSIEEFGEAIDDITAKAKGLEKSYEGASKILLEDANILSVLDNVRNKLLREKSSGSIDQDMMGSLDNCLRNLNRLLDDGADGADQQPVERAPEPALQHRGPDQSRLVGGPPQEQRWSLDRDSNSSLISQGMERPKKPAAEKPKELNDLLKSDHDVQKFLCESIALVLLQTGRKSYTKDGLYKLVTEVMKKLELTEKGNLIGNVASKFNALNIVKSTIKNPPPAPVKNPAMDLLSFTPEELVCLLRNFDTLSAEEKKCFQYYMHSLQMKRPNLSAVETNILDLYLMKTRQVPVDTMMGNNMPPTGGMEEVYFRPTSFDYEHTKHGFGGRSRRDGRDHRRDEGRDLRDDRRRSYEKRPERRRSRSRERPPRRDIEDRGRAADRYAEKRRGEDIRDRLGKAPAATESSSAKKQKTTNEGPAGRPAQVDEMEAFRAEMEKQKANEEAESAQKLSAVTRVETNLDGSENLERKYKDAALNEWLRRGSEEKAMFTEAMEDGALTFKCNACNSTLYGVRNVQSHYNGKKHKKKLEEDQWSTFDPTKECPKPQSGGQGDTPMDQTLQSEYGSFMEQVAQEDPSDPSLEQGTENNDEIVLD